MAERMDTCKKLLIIFLMQHPEVRGAKIVWRGFLLNNDWTLFPLVFAFVNKHMFFFFWPWGTFACGLFLLESEINYAAMPTRLQKELSLISQEKIQNDN